jgi:hypothetical protein
MPDIGKRFVSIRSQLTLFVCAMPDRCSFGCTKLGRMANALFKVTIEYLT